MQLIQGIFNLGWAVLDLIPQGEKLLTYGVVRTRRFKTNAERTAEMMRRLAALFREYTPAVLAYETYVYFGKKTIDITSSYKVHQIIGGIAMLAQFPPYPALIEFLPKAWGLELTGSASHTKEMVARCVSLRLGLTITSTDGAHHSDAIGLGLVALAHWQRDQQIKHTEQTLALRQWGHRGSLNS